MSSESKLGFEMVREEEKVRWPKDLFSLIPWFLFAILFFLTDSASAHERLTPVAAPNPLGGLDAVKSPG